MDEYIRNAFKSLEDLKVVIEPVKVPTLLEDVEAEPLADDSGKTIKDLFDEAGSYILTHSFDNNGEQYELFIEALQDGESCDILFDTYDVNNINEVLIEILDKEHDFIDSLHATFDLTSSVTDVTSAACSQLNGEEATTDTASAEEDEPDKNVREYTNPEDEAPSEESTEDELPPVKTDIEVTDVEKEEKPEDDTLTESQTFNIQDDEEAKKAESVIDKKDTETIEQIVDATAVTEDDLQKSYIGQIVLQCPTCRARIFKSMDELVKAEGEDEGEELYNVDEECPHCGAKEGFTLLGQIASLDVDPYKEPDAPSTTPEETTTEVEDTTVEEEPPVKADPLPEFPHEEEKEEPVHEDISPEAAAVETEIKLTTEEKNMLDNLTRANKMDCWYWYDDDRDCVIDTEEEDKVMDTCDAVLLIDDGTEDIDRFLDPEEVALFKDLVERCKACKAARKAKETVKEDSDCETCEGCGEHKTSEVTLEAIDEFKYDRLINRYLRETYANVRAYTTTHAAIKDDTNNIIVEGTIAFKNGKTKNTKFVFEAKEITKKNKLKLVGMNETFSNSKKAFTLLGQVDNKRLVCESLAYRYDAGDKKVKGKIDPQRKR